MAGREIADFEELLHELGRARSLRARLRVLGHGWGLLRELPPEKREQVALRLGSDWAWKRVERAFLADGELSDSERLVGRAFERLRDSDPTELRALAGTLKEGGPEGARDLLVMTLTEALEEEAEEDEDTAEPAAEAAPSEEAAPEAAAPRPAQPKPAARPEVVRDVGSVLASTLASEIRQDTADPEPTAATATPEADPATPPAPSDVPVAATPFESVLAIEPRPVTGTAPAPRTALAALRELARSTRPGADLGRSGRAQLLDSLGDGWAPRRALSAMIAARGLDDLDEALGLVAQLASPSQRAWCLADLLASWPLEPQEVSRVLDAAPSEAARRRLERRWQRTLGEAVGG